MGINLSRSAIGIAKRLPEETLIAATAPIAPRKAPEKIQKSVEPAPETNLVSFLSKSETKQITDKFKPLPPVLRTALRDTQTLHREFKALERLTQSPEAQTNSGGVDSNQETPITQKENFPVEQIDPAATQSLQNQVSRKSNEVEPVQTNRVKNEEAKAHLVLQKETEAPKKIVLAAVDHEVKLNPRFPITFDRDVPVNLNSTAKVSHPLTPLRTPLAPQPPRPLVQERLAFDLPIKREEGKKNEPPHPESLPVRELPNLEKGPRIVKPFLATPLISEVGQPRPLKPSSFIDRVISALALNNPRPNSGVLRLGRQRVFEAFQRRVREGAIHDFVEQARQVVRSLEVHPINQAVSQAGVITHQNVRFAGVAPLQPIPHSADNRVNSPSFRIETVAQIPSREDNGFRSQPVQGRERGSLGPEKEKGPKNSPVGVALPPPLTNLKPPQRPLPTNVRSRLVRVSSVNLLDLVL